MYIKFLNIFRQDKKIQNLLSRKLQSFFKTGNFILGKEVELFENNFKKYFNAKHCISCANGSDALYMSIMSLNLKKKSEILIPGMTYIATAHAAQKAGMKIKLVDTDKSGCLDFVDLKKKITNKTKALIVVNLYGQKSVSSQIIRLCNKFKVKIIEDSAQGHAIFDCENCDHNKNKAKMCCKKKIYQPSQTDISCFSFFPGKNLGCYGDGGAIITNNTKYERFIRAFRNNGSINKKNYTYIGINSRLDAIQACILNLKIKYLKENNIKRMHNAEFFYKNIKNKKILPIQQRKGSVFHQFIISSKNRDFFCKYLKKKNIEFGIHYNKAIDQYKVYRFLKNQNLKNAYEIAKNYLSIPVDPHLTDKEREYIVSTINKY